VLNSNRSWNSFHLNAQNSSTVPSSVCRTADKQRLPMSDLSAPINCQCDSNSVQRPLHCHTNRNDYDPCTVTFTGTITTHALSHKQKWLRPLHCHIHRNDYDPALSHKQEWLQHFTTKSICPSYSQMQMYTGTYVEISTDHKLSWSYNSTNRQ